MEEQELPAGWATATGSEIFELVTSGSRGWAKYYSDDGPLFIRIGNLDHGSIALDLEEVQRVTPPDDSEGKRTRLEPNDILISITAELGMVALVPEDLGEAYVNQHVALARPSSEIDPRFLAWYLASESDGKKQLLEAKRGATKVGLGLPDIRNLILPLAPLNEQRRIAAKLDATLAAVDACRQRLDGVAELLKRFRQAVLAAATSGELTREWREEWSKQDLMENVSLGEVIIEMRNGLSPKPSMSPPGVKILRIGAVRSGSIDWEDHRYLELSAQEVKSFRLQVDDLIFTRYNGTLEFVGVCARVGEVSDQYVYPDKLIRARCDPDKALPAYVEISFGADSVRSQVEGCVKSSAGQKGISGGDLKGIRFSLPSIEEQQEIVRRAQELFTLADQLEARLHSARRVVDRLTPALLAKAFRGELVPQDPSDEPASALLERIRAARQAEAAAGKPSRRGRKKAAAHPDPTSLGLDSKPAAVSSDPTPPDQLATLLQECGPLSEKALLAASELEPGRFLRQLQLELQAGTIREALEEGERVLVGGGIEEGAVSRFTLPSQVTRLKPCVLRDSGQHPRPDLLTIMEGKDEVGIALMRKGPMRS